MEKLGFRRRNEAKKKKDWENDGTKKKKDGGINGGEKEKEKDGEHFWKEDAGRGRKWK